MNRLQACAALALTCFLAGCAGTTALSDRTPGVMGAGSATAASAAMNIVPGQTTRADLGDTLGQATVVRFDSGWEVWVYRWPGADATPRAATELVALLEPSGVVRKVRVRPGYPPASR